MRRRLVVASVLAGVVATGCGIPDEGPMMDPGSNCLACHSGGGEAPKWQAGGTLYSNPDALETEGLLDAEVTLTDTGGKRVTMKTNAAGNFYTAEDLRFPVEVEVRQGDKVKRMEGKAQNGSCNACHTVPGVSGAPGRIFLR